MNALFEWIELIAIIQLCVVMGLILFAYSIKIYQHYHALNKQKKYQHIHALLVGCIQQQNDKVLPLIQAYHPQIILMLSVIQDIDRTTYHNNLTWQSIHQQILKSFLLPKARKLAQAKNWMKRYTYCQVLHSYFVNTCLIPTSRGLSAGSSDMPRNIMGKRHEQLASFEKLNVDATTLEKRDESDLLILIDDPVPLVSINAAMLALQCNSKKLVNTVIDVFSKRRRVQQAFYAEITSSANPALAFLIIERLCHEKNAYVKAFCYRFLMLLPVSSKRIASLDSDVTAHNLDLKLAALSYSQYCLDPTLPKKLVVLLDDAQWEVRARAAKLIGETKDHQLATHLDKSLRDPVWWVRMNAGQALANLGKPGLAILRRQAPHIDQFAYDTAMLVLAKVGGSV